MFLTRPSPQHIPLILPHSCLGDHLLLPSVLAATRVINFESSARFQRFSIYVDHTGIKVPSVKNPLYGLLESMAIPVKAPKGGVFHPKIWVLRFVQPDMDEPPLIRLLVLSRNITYDRSWDISLQLEGQPGWRINQGNQQLVEFLQALPSLSTGQVPEAQQQQAIQLAEEIRKKAGTSEWIRFRSFHILG